MKNFKNPTTFQVHSFFINMVHFLLCLSMLRKKPFPVSKYAKDSLHIEKGTLTASCSKPLLFMSIEANVTAWRFLMSALAKNI